MSRLTSLEFRDTLTDAINEHSAEYAAVYSLSIRWACDDVRAFTAAMEFQKILDILQLPSATELTIEKSDSTPGWTAQGKLRELLASAKNSIGRALVIVHYAGQGLLSRNALAINLCDRLNTRRFVSFDVDTFLISLALPVHYDLRTSANVDVLFVLDCDYPLGASYAPTLGTHVVEVLAAVDEDYSCSYHDTPSLAEHLRNEIARRHKEGARYVEVADLVRTLKGRSDLNMTPTHNLKLGASSICLPLAGLKNPVNYPRIHPSLKAVFTVQVADNMTREQLDQLVSFIRNAGPDIALTLQSIYPSD
ncbi:hypothetical protein BJX96DRAFT_36826 [Aspergillus floccosus]